MERLLPPTHHIPALDGVRGAAILLVVLFHAFPAWLPGGFIGVDVFFVLSGYLTAAGLMRECADTGRVAIGAFFWRRLLRLGPALVLLLVADVAYEAIAHGDLEDGLIDSALVLAGVANWSWALGFDRPGLLAHCWTVSVEEQFYLLAPALVVALARRWRLAALLMIAGVAAMAVWRLVLARQGSAPLRLFDGFDTRLGALLIGVLLGALHHHGGHVWHRVAAATSVLGPLAAALLLYAATVLDWTDLGARLGGFEIVALAAGLVIAAAAAPRAGALQRALSLRALRRLGNLSYGLFLWHFPLIWIIAGDPTRAASSHLVLALALSLGTAQASSHFVERPVLAWSRRGKIRAPAPVAVGSSATG